ncbi:Uncharacterised protein [Bordetella pertussis]|nr:Uncharacterised protein [Bordetella pertussis]
MRNMRPIPSNCSRGRPLARRISSDRATASAGTETA